MPIKLFAMLVLLSTSSNLALAEERPPLVVPEGAKISLTPFKEKWLLGENILLYYEVKNTGTEPFVVESGFDYQGGTRAKRFKVMAFNEAGEIQADPSPSQMDMGGTGGGIEVKPGESWFGNVQIMRYRHFSKPGKYTIRVGHDLGWQTDKKHYPFQWQSSELEKEANEAVAKDDPRWVETTIEVAMPTEEQAVQVLVEMLEMKRPDRDFGNKAGPFPDLNSLRYPIYVPPLLKLSRVHHQEGVWGLGNQYTPESTSALIELLFLADDAGTRHGNNELLNQRHIGYVHQDETIAETAAHYLSFRVPHPQLASGDKQTFGGDESYRQQRLQRIADAWRDKHVEPARKYARNVLLNERSRGLSDGRKENAVSILRGIGTQEDHAVIVKALEDALKVSHYYYDENPGSIQSGEGIFHPGLLSDLQQCVKALKIEPKAMPETPAEIIVYLEAMRYEGEKIPSEFEKFALQWLKHKLAYVRRLTIEALPRPIPAWAKPELASLMRSPYVGVRLEATRAVKETADAQFREAIMERIAVEKDDWVMAELDRAAKATGVPRDLLLEAWAKRLGEQVYDQGRQRFGPGAKSFDLLASNVFIFNGAGRNGHADVKENHRVSKRWLEFIDFHRQELLAGRRYPIGDPEMTEDLFPAGTTIQNDNGQQWPPQRSKKPQ